MYATATDQPSTSVTLQSCDALQLLMQAGCDGAQHREQKPRSRQQPRRLHDCACPANAHPLPRRRRENRRLASVSPAGSQPRGRASQHAALSALGGAARHQRWRPAAARTQVSRFNFVMAVDAILRMPRIDDAGRDDGCGKQYDAALLHCSSGRRRYRNQALGHRGIAHFGPSCKACQRRRAVNARPPLYTAHCRCDAGSGVRQLLSLAFTRAWHDSSS